MEPEYILFELNDSDSFEALNSCFARLKKSKDNNHLPSPEELNLPEEAKEYLKHADWSVESLISVICENLEIKLLQIEQLENNKGKLTYEAFSYPYGGPGSLIVLIKSFNCLPIEADDGSGIYQIEWKDNFKFQFVTRATKKRKGLLERLFNR